MITHQKRTMEIADALYGVSMRGDGVSTVLFATSGERVSRLTVMKSRTRIAHFDSDIVILAWQTMAQELFHLHRMHRSRGCTTCKTVPSPFRLTVDNDCLKGASVTSIVVAMIVILVVVACIVGLVLLGMEAREAARHDWPTGWRARPSISMGTGAARSSDQADRVQPRSLSRAPGQFGHCPRTTLAVRLAPRMCRWMRQLCG